MKLNQEIVLHQDHYDRSKCCTWTDKQDHLVCVRPVSSSLQAAGHWQSPRGMPGPVLSTRLQGGLTEMFRAEYHRQTLYINVLQHSKCVADD